MPLRVDVKEVALLAGPNPFPVVVMKAVADPQEPVEFAAILCSREQSLLPPTLQMVAPFTVPTTVQLKVKVSPGQMVGGAVNCPAASPGERYNTHTFLHSQL